MMKVIYIFTAYIMNYYKHSIESIIDKPMEYTVNSLRNIFTDVLELSKCGIIAAYLNNPDNVVVGDDKITIIDIDAYEFEYEKDSAFIFNTYLVYNLFVRLFLREIKEKYNKDIDIISPLLCGSLSYDKSHLNECDLKKQNDEICLKLSKYKYPYDLLKDKK